MEVNFDKLTITDEEKALLESVISIYNGVKKSVEAIEDETTGIAPDLAVIATAVMENIDDVNKFIQYIFNPLKAENVINLGYWLARNEGLFDKEEEPTPDVP
jgi:hypothetical protein